jgi:purine-binding chemotaxis protein CheW
VTAVQLLLFRCSDQMLAVEAGAVREILAAGGITRIPGAPAAVRGLVNVRGTLLPVVDGARAIGLATGGEASTLLLLERGGRPVALAVDEVMDLVTVPETALAPGAALPGIRADVVQAVGDAGGKPFVQLAVQAVLDPLLP